MVIDDRETVRTGGDDNPFLRLGSVHTVTEEYDALTTELDLVYESLEFERIDDTIQGREVHPFFFGDEELLEFGEGDMRFLTDDLSKSSAVHRDTGIHRELKAKR